MTIPSNRCLRTRPQDGKVRQVMELINNSDIIEDCYAIIRDYSQKASRCLDILPQCEAASLPSEFVRLHLGAQSVTVCPSPPPGAPRPAATIPNQFPL